jgi:hypothetical protein
MYFLANFIFSYSQGYSPLCKSSITVSRQVDERSHMDTSVACVLPLAYEMIRIVVSIVPFPVPQSRVAVVDEIAPTDVSVWLFRPPQSSHVVGGRIFGCDEYKLASGAQ